MISRRDSFLSCPLYLHALTFFVCLFVLFNSCCSHARVFGKTLAHEFQISYCHAELYFIFSLFGARETKHAQWHYYRHCSWSGRSNHLIKKKCKYWLINKQSVDGMKVTTQYIYILFRHKRVKIIFVIEAELAELSFLKSRL